MEKSDIQQKRHETLVGHIKKRVSKGHDIIKIRQDLISRGFIKREVHKAMDVAYKEIQKIENFEKKVKTFLEPKKGKFVLPLILLIILIIHFLANVYLLPEVGELMCDSAEITKSMFKLTKSKVLTGRIRTELDTLEKQNLDKRMEIISKYNILLTANFPFILTQVHRLDPFFPLACESKLILESPNCRYYMSEDDYNCIINLVNTDNETVNMLGEDMPSFNPISLSTALINSLILLLEVYLINCIIIHLHNKLKNKVTPKTKKTLEFMAVMVAIFIIILAIYTYVYAFSIL